MRRLTKRILAMGLSAAMIFTAAPVSFFAAEKVVSQGTEDATRSIVEKPQNGISDLGTEISLPVGGWSPVEMVMLDEDAYDSLHGNVLTKHTNVINEPLTEDSVFIRGEGIGGYRALTDDQREFYDRIGSVVFPFFQRDVDLLPSYLQIDGEQREVYVLGEVVTDRLDQSQAMQAFYAFDYDHPAFYWISNTVYCSVSITDSGETITSLILITDEAYATASVRTEINKKITDGVLKYAALAELAEDTLDKIAVIHDAILSDIDYAWEAEGVPVSDKWAHSVHGVFDENYKKATCEGYSDAFSLMMNYLGICNYIIVGTAKAEGESGEGGHAWNLVSDDGGESYMYMDLAWDDHGDGKFCNLYFGMPKSDFESCHTANTDVYILPENISDTFEGTYYYRAGLFCGEMPTQDFAKYISTKAGRFGYYYTCLSDDSGKIARTNRWLNGGNSLKISSVSYKNNTYYLGWLDNVNRPIDISDGQIDLDRGYRYCEPAVEPIPNSVTVNGVKLIKDLDYILSYNT